MHDKRWKIGLLTSLLFIGCPVVSVALPQIPVAIAVQPTDELNTLLEQGRQQYHQGQLREALQTLQSLLEKLQQHRDRQTPTLRQTQGETLNELGLVYEALGQYDAALQAHQESLAIHRALSDRQGEGVALSNIGIIYSRTSEYAKALEMYQQALKLLRAVGDREAEAATLSAMGRVYRNLSNYPQALALYQQALKIQQEIPNPRGEATTLNNLGVTYTYLDDYPQALKVYEQALAIHRQLGDRRAEGLLLSNVGSVYDSQGKYATALSYYEQALAIRREIGDRAGEGSTLNSLGFMYDNLGQYEQALKVYQQALTVRREIGDRSGEGITLNNMGRLHNSLKQLDQALTAYQQALAVHQAVGNRTGEGVTLNNLGEVYRQQGQFTKALQFYQQALQIRQEVGDRAGEGTTLNNLGATYDATGETPKAITAYQQALKIFQAIGDRPREASTLGNLGALYHRLGQPANAEPRLQESITSLESLRPGLSDANKVSIFETQAANYRLLEQVLVAQNKTTAALEVSERGRARAFVELLATKLTPQQTTTAIATTPPTIADIQTIARQHQATLVEYSIISESLGSGTQLRSQEAYLYIWVVKPTGEVYFRQTNLQPFWQATLTTSQPIAQLADLVAAARGSLGVAGRGLAFKENTEVIDRIAANVSQTATNFQQLRQLHQLLIDPIADLLPTEADAPVIFIPQSSLFLVPFAALQDTTGRYLIEKHTILTAPAIQVLDLTRQQRQKVQQAATQSILVLGNPTMPSLPPAPGETAIPLPELPGAEQEARAIASLLQTKAITGQQATKATLLQKLPQARIIHLATHGLLDDIAGLGTPGAIALAPTSTDNGFLTASEILQLQLNADLVVLSACDTGRGRITGDGVIGLSRSLISAGTPSVIVSLWQVPDAPTASLMTTFYQNWRPAQSDNLQTSPDRLDKAQALRQAMLTTLEQYPDPRDWAGFMLVGEAD